MTKFLKVGRKIPPKGRERNVYWAIRKAVTRNPSIGYGFIRSKNKYVKKKFNFIYLGRWSAKFIVDRSNGKYK